MCQILNNLNRILNLENEQIFMNRTLNTTIWS